MLPTVLTQKRAKPSMDELRERVQLLLTAVAALEPAQAASAEAIRVLNQRVDELQHREPENPTRPSALNSADFCTCGHTRFCHSHCDSKCSQCAHCSGFKHSPPVISGAHRQTSAACAGCRHCAEPETDAVCQGCVCFPTHYEPESKP